MRSASIPAHGGLAVPDDDRLGATGWFEATECWRRTAFPPDAHLCPLEARVVSSIHPPPDAFEVGLPGDRQQVRQFSVITAMSALRTRLLAADAE